MPRYVRQSVVPAQPVLLTSHASGRATAAGVASDPTTQPLLQFSDLSYVGGFRLPAGISNGDSFAFGGRPIGYNPIGNSLFVASYAGNVAEVSIPTPVNSNMIGTKSIEKDWLV